MNKALLLQDVLVIAIGCAPLFEAKYPVLSNLGIVFLSVLLLTTIAYIVFLKNRNSQYETILYCLMLPVLIIASLNCTDSIAKISLSFTALLIAIQVN